jgi:hypothetical protein
MPDPTVQSTGEVSGAQTHVLGVGASGVRSFQAHSLGSTGAASEPFVEGHRLMQVRHPTTRKILFAGPASSSPPRPLLHEAYA